ncbi:MAG: HAD family hydrolase [Promethearchaeati archaeon SRVP18_Atabeyarchaeia-1]
MKAKAVLFDLGGTLIRSAELYDTFHRILKLKGIRRSRDDVKEAMLEAERELKKEYGSKVPGDAEYYVRWNLNILHRLRIYERDTELAEEIDKHWFDYMEIQPHAGMSEVLRALKKRGVKLGVVTNGYESDLEKILPKLDVGDAFDILVAADTVGKKKPDPGVFLYAIKRLKVNPGETVFVGDEYDNDYVGAEKAGMVPFLLETKKRKMRRRGANRINVIHSLPELLSRIET